MELKKAPLLSATGASSGTIEIPETFFTGSPSLRVLHEAITAYQANKRRGTSSTKTRGLVSGGGRKPWKQKGTGNARSGSNRSPLWRKGGIIFGPLPRSYKIDVTSGKRAIALQTAILEKLKAGQLNVVETLTFKKGKTQEAAKFFEKTGFQGRVLVVVDKNDDSSTKAIRNLDGITLINASKINALDLLHAGVVVVTKASLELLGKRLGSN